MSSQKIIGSRYELREIVGRGGMGVVYKAYDRIVGREVALKTLGDIQSRAALDMFYKEWQLLANLRHPNIVDIFDIGDFEDEGGHKPFFVMPLLPGTTLDHLLRLPGQPVTLERLVEIISQTCKGLQAIHDSGLVHRDIKPSNIFVMDFASVKLIDFGIAHLMGGNTATGLKGTVSYMSPEQIQNQECTPSSDIFSLGVVCYEALTGVKPFQGKKADDIFHAIVHSIPTPISELKPTVNQTVSRAVHKALAKNPRHRYTSAPEFAETLQRALRGEVVPSLDPSRIQPRIQRAIKAFEQGRYDMATDILADLEAAGHIDPALTPLRNQIDQALRRQKIRDLLDRAKLGLEEDEPTLALQSAEAAVSISPDSEEAIKLRDSIRLEIARRDAQDLLAGAERAIDQYAFSRARQLLQRVLDSQPGSEHASLLMQRLESREQAYRALRQEKDDVYRAAKEAWQNSEFATAVAKLQRVLTLESQAPDTSSPDTRANYSNFLNLAESARAAIETLRTEVEAAIANGQFDRAASLCSEVAARYPGHPMPHGLRLLTDACQRRESIVRMAEIAHHVDAEPDLERRLDILRQALEEFPNHALFDQWSRALRDRLAVALSTMAKARAHEEHGRFLEALEQWNNVRSVYPEHPALDREIARVAALAGEPAPVSFREPPPRPPTPLFTAPPGPPAQQEMPPPPPPPPVAPPIAKQKFDWTPIRASWDRFQERVTTFVRQSPSRKWIVAGTASVCVLLIAVAMFATREDASRSRTVEPPKPQKARVILKTPTRGATIRLNDIQTTSDSFNVEVAPGTYSLDVSADGYESYKEALSIPATGLERSLPALRPLPSAIRISTDLPKTFIRLDDRPALTITEPDFTINDLPPGEHGIAVSDGANEARLMFTTADVTAPRFRGPIQAKGIHAFAVSSFTASVQMAAAGSPSPDVLLDTRPPDENRDGVATFHRVARAVHELLMNPGKKEERRFAIDASPRPTMWLGIYSDRNVGMLQVSVGLDQFTVFVDGALQQRRIRDGSMFITNLVPKIYKVSVAADGYDRSAEQEIEIKKSSLARLPVTLTKTAQFAQLSLRGLPPRTQVLIDGNAAGTTDTEGNASIDKIEPAEHTVQLKGAPQFKSSPVKKSFNPRETAVISASEFHIERAPATIYVSANPEGARLDWTCAGKAHQAAAPQAITCLDKQVNVRASAPGYQDETKSSPELAPGLEFSVKFDLKKTENIQTAAPKNSCTSSDLAKNGWTAMDGGAYAAPPRGASLPCGNIVGVYQFMATPPKGFMRTKTLNWSLVGSAGKADFVVDKKAVTVSGQRKNVDTADRDGGVSFRVVIDPDKATVAVRSGGSWETISTLTSDSRKVHVEFGKDARISNFDFKER